SQLRQPPADPTRPARRRAPVRGVDSPGLDVDAAGDPPAGEARNALEHRDPEVELDLLGEAQVRVEQVGESIAAPRPRLDLEHEELAAVAAELDLTRLEVPVERRQAERARR